ncbi:MAG TPA: carboxypeptidase-like regulatory domain-containing protein, partial [Ohtaekwangia sp.]|uniref:carboxypeptidase-like regulatory domain-containing protein n=1 Tax=Ohtaekwangia sp. TaxID=2066019 RepID=UPI002F926262
MERILREPVCRNILLLFMVSVLQVSVAKASGVAGTIRLQQGRQVTGLVTNDKNEPIPGVSILQRGTSNGTMTDAEGKYILTVSDTAVLIFTAIGFIREDVAVGNQVIINVSLTEDLIGLEEVVVVGYG